jgi:hypothetical protein
MALSPLKAGTPGSIMEYIKQHQGIQTSTKYHVLVDRPGYATFDFLCSMIQLPSKKIKSYGDMLSGVSSPIGIPFGLEYQNNLMEFIVEGDWASRSYFEGWAKTIFVGPENTVRPNPSKVKYVDEFYGTVTIEAIDITNKVSAIYYLRECFPIQIVPSKFEDMATNTPVKFMVEIFYNYYDYRTAFGTELT